MEMGTSFGMGKYRWRLGWGALACILLIPCAWGARPEAYFSGTRSDANVYVAPVASSIHKIAILPLKAPTELIGSSVADIVVTEMMRAGRYTLVERGQMSQVLGEAELALAGLSESAAVEVGKMMGADGVVIGTVDEYGMVAHRGRSYPVVGVSLRLIDCDSGRVMWSVGHARRGNDPAGTLSSHARAVVHEVVAAVVQNWRVQRQVGEKYDDARGTRDRPDDLVGMHGDPVAPTAPAFEPPQAPDSVAISDFGLREVRLQWTPPADRSIQYRVERAESPAGPFAVLATLAAARGAYVDSGTARAPLQDAGTYYYRLTAIGPDGQESEPGGVLESMTAPPPEPPAELQALTPAARAVQLQWAAPSSEGVTSYQVERAAASDEVFALVGTVKTTTYHEGGTAASPLRDSTPYLYRVRAINRVGAVGEFSKPVEVITRPPPAAPQNVTAESQQVRCVPLSWQASQEEDVTHYIIYRSESDAGVFTSIGTVKGRENAKYLDGGRDPGTLEDDQAYFYCIRAVNAVGAESDDSEVVMAGTRPPPPPVSRLAAQSGQPRKVALSWQPSADEKVIGYDLERSEAGGPFAPVGRLSGREIAEYEDGGGELARSWRSGNKNPLQDGTPYIHRIRAVNTAGAASPWVETAGATTKVVPAKPTGLKASERRARVIGLVWAANPEKDIAEYVVAMSPFPDRNFTETARIPAGATRGLKQENLPPDLTRYYRVKAVDADGLESEWSDVVCGTTKPLPAAPAELAVEWEEDGARLQWTPPPERDIVRYRVLNKRLFGQDEISTCTSPSILIPLATLAPKKVFIVIAVDKDGLESPPSPPLEARPPR